MSTEAKDSQRNNRLVHIKLYDSTRTASSVEMLGINKFFLPRQQNGVDYSKMNNLENIIKKIMRQFKKYKIEPGTTIILYVERNENMHIISQIYNICLWLHNPLLLEIYDSEDKSYNAPILMYGSDDASAKYINRVTWYAMKVKLEKLDRYKEEGIFEEDEEDTENEDS